MQVHTSTRSDVSQWERLLGELHENADELVTEFFLQVTRIPPYRRDVVPHTVVRADAIKSFDYLLRRLAGMSMPEWLTGLSESIGRDRAHRDLPLEHLLNAVRLDFQVLWSALRRRADQDDLETLVAHVEEVWQVVDSFTNEIQISFLEERAIMARKQSRDRVALVNRFLDSGAEDLDDLRRVALALGVDIEDTLLVAAAPAHHDGRLHDLYERLLAEDRRAHWQPRGQWSVLLLRWQGDAHAVQSVLAGANCAFAPLSRGAARIPRSVRAATRLAAVLGPDEEDVLGVHDLWDRLAAASLGDLAEDLADAVLSGLDGVRSEERERLLAAVEVWLDHGSIAEVAQRLFCHRNTVINRLRRFKELTGHDVAIPRHAALVAMALCCRTKETRSSSRSPSAGSELV